MPINCLCLFRIILSFFMKYSHAGLFSHKKQRQDVPVSVFHFSGYIISLSFVPPFSEGKSHPYVRLPFFSVISSEAPLYVSVQDSALPYSPASSYRYCSPASSIVFSYSLFSSVSRFVAVCRLSIKVMQHARFQVYAPFFAFPTYPYSDSSYYAGHSVLVDGHLSLVFVIAYSCVVRASYPPYHNLGLRFYPCFPIPDFLSVFR